MLDVHKYRKAKKLTQEQLGEIVGLDAGTISRIERGERWVTEETLNELARALEISPRMLIRHDAPVAVAGRVGAGARVDLVNAYEKGDGLYHIGCPTNLSPHAIVGVEVKGNSMEPMIREGDVLLFSRNFEGVDMDDMDEIVICETVGGEALVKQIKPGRDPGTFDLHSARDGLDPIYGARLKWAARLRQHLRRDEVQVIER